MAEKPTPFIKALTKAHFLTKKDMQNKTLQELYVDLGEEFGELGAAISITKGSFGKSHKELDESWLGETADVVIMGMAMFFSVGSIGDLYTMLTQKNYIEDLNENKLLEIFNQLETHGFRYLSAYNDDIHRAYLMLGKSVGRIAETLLEEADATTVVQAKASITENAEHIIAIGIGMYMLLSDEPGTKAIPEGLGNIMLKKLAKWESNQG